AKITVSEPSHVLKISSEVEKLPSVDSIKENDIKFYRRYLIDKKIIPCTLCRAAGEIIKTDFDVDLVLKAEKVGAVSSDLISDPKIIGFDIETKCKGGFPNALQDPIIMVSFFGKNFRKVVTWKRFSDAPEYVMFVDGELELIEEFKKTIKKLRPDILVGYNSDSFDIKFIKERANKYDIILDLGVDKSELESKGFNKIKGIVHIDIFKFIRNFLTLRTDFYDLNSVAKELIGEGKYLDIKLNKINELWGVGLKQDLINLVEYNLKDSKLAYNLCVNLLPTQLQLVKLIGLPLADINRMTYGILVEWFLINNAYRFNQIVPRYPKYKQIIERIKYTYSGGFVIKPKPGLYKDICVFDFKSFWPSIIASHNIDPATSNCNCCKFKGGHKVSEETWFCSKEKGFIPKLVKDLIDRRYRVKKILSETSASDSAQMELKARQYAIKTITNSIYGYMAYANSRWYNPECSKAITSIGKKYIQDVIKEAEKFGFKILYADTDSIFFLQGEKNKEEVMRFLKIINSILPSPMELELEGFFPAGLFLEKKAEGGGAKKRYALLDETGNISVKGLEAVRGDWSNIAREAQRAVIEIILKKNNVKAAINYVQGLVKTVKEHRVPVSEFVISKRLTKKLSDYSATSPHVAAAKLAENKNIIMRKGSLVNYVVGEGSGKISDRVILAEDAKKEDYDADYYIDNQIIRAVYKIFEIFDYPKEKIKEGQTTLEGFK
ncbi:DUF1744 domain-containing protein, partial [Candidatus Woesearchaeota archaeon]|nr:DUF1744 domain-containing protein [Candidatus Woesearchaeota archaeon]